MVSDFTRRMLSSAKNLYDAEVERRRILKEAEGVFTRAFEHYIAEHNLPRDNIEVRVFDSKEDLGVFTEPELHYKVFVRLVPTYVENPRVVDITSVLGELLSNSPVEVHVTRAFEDRRGMDDAYVYGDKVVSPVE